jgi:hypothetical protein
MNIPRPISGWVPPADSVRALTAFKDRMSLLRIATINDLTDNYDEALVPFPRYEIRNMISDEIHERIYGQ